MERYGKVDEYRPNTCHPANSRGALSLERWSSGTLRSGEPATGYPIFIKTGLDAPHTRQRDSDIHERQQ